MSYLGTNETASTGQPTERPVLISEAQRQQESAIENMWSTGQWRDGRVFSQWMSSSLPPILFALKFSPPRVWLASTHCAIVGPQQGRCTDRLPGNRLMAAGVAILPFLTGYYAWKKKDGSIPWTVAGAAAGMTAPVVIGLLGFVALAGGMARY